MRTWLFALLVASAACKGKSDDKPPAPAAAPAKPPATPIANEPPIAVAGAPAECVAYKATIEKLATCDKLDVQTRARLRHDYNVHASDWAKLADKSGLGQTCKDADDAIGTQFKQTCGW